MKNYIDFIKTLDAEFYVSMANQLHNNDIFLDAPNEEAKRHAEIAIIASFILGEYHEWMTELPE